ncbi:MAG: glycyl-radical enzyme activating protein [Clostridia bacterium]|nr:glycyl-radical enzyme activating protein [Clostridia bacterium]
MGTVFNIQKFCVNDGPGIRTSVFMKGCPLRCAWCHNPESQRHGYELAYDEEKCLSCGRCLAKCKNGAHDFSRGSHRLLRENCVGCGECVGPVCPATELFGKEMSAAQVVDEVLRDSIFYETSGGGMTLTGGEPMAQFDFAMELLELAKEKGLHVCMETCGYASAENYAKVSKFVDLFLWDWKLTDRELHKMYTGVYNDLIIDNLRLLNDMGAKFILRCPIIPGVNDNDDHFAGIANVANTFEGVLAVEIEPYHPLGKAKCDRLGREYSIGDVGFPDDKDAKRWIDIIKTKTEKEVRRG